MRKNLLWALAATVLVTFAGCGPVSEDEANEGNGGNGGNGGNARPEERKSLDLSFIPEDCFFAMVIHPKRIAESPLAKELSEDVTGEVFGGMNRVMRNVDLRKTEEMVVLGLPHEPTGRRYEPPLDGGFIIRFSEPIADREFKRMFGHMDFADEEATHAGEEYFRGWFLI